MSGSEGSRTKSESKLKGSQLQLASKKWEPHWNDSGNPHTRIRANKKISVTKPKKLEAISSLFLALTLFLPSSLGVLAWQLSSLRLLHLVRESKLPVLGFYIPKASPSKERSSRYQSSMMFSEWPTSDHLYSPRSAILAGPWGPMTGFTLAIGPDPAAHMILSFLQNCMTEGGERQPQG